MTYKGIIKGNTIIVDTPMSLEDGTEVEIILTNNIDPICGSWQDERPADEIINEIRAARFSRVRKVEL